MLRQLVTGFAVFGLTLWVPFGFFGLDSVTRDTPILLAFVVVGAAASSMLFRSAIKGFFRTYGADQAATNSDAASTREFYDRNRNDSDRDLWT